MEEVFGNDRTNTWIRQMYGCLHHEKKEKNSVYLKTE